MPQAELLGILNNYSESVPWNLHCIKRVCVNYDCIQLHIATSMYVTLAKQFLVVSNVGQHRYLIFFWLYFNSYPNSLLSSFEDGYLYKLGKASGGS